MKPSICVLTLIFAVLAIAEGNHNAGNQVKTRQNNFNPVQPVITVYKIAEQSDLPADYAKRPDKYELIRIGVLQNDTSNANARNGLCILARRRKRSLYVQKETIHHEEKKTSESRKGKARSYSGSNIKIKQPFIFRGYLSKENAAAIEQQFKPVNEHTYFRAGNPNTEHQHDGRPLRFFPKTPPPPPPPPPSFVSSFPPSSGFSYPWTGSSFPFPSPGFSSGFGSLPIIASGPGIVQANYQNTHCTIITKAFDLNANGQTLRLRRESN